LHLLLVVIISVLNWHFAQHYLTMLGATVVIPTLLVPAMGGSDDDKAQTIQRYGLIRSVCLSNACLTVTIARDEAVRTGELDSSSVNLLIARSVENYL
jgi:hypothetical protein